MVNLQNLIDLVINKAKINLINSMSFLKTISLISGMHLDTRYY